MQVIQSVLGTKLQPLGIGVRKPLGYSHRLLSRKESSSLYGHSAIKPLANHVPLVTYSQFLLSHENQAFSDPFIDANSPEPEYINPDFPLIQFDTVDSVIKDSHLYTNEDIQGDIPNILPTQNTSNTNNITPELNIKVKTKSKAKSRTTKTTKLSANENSNRQVDDVSVNNMGLIKTDETPVVDANFETHQTPKLQTNIVGDSSISDKETDSIPSIVDDESVLVGNFAIDETQAIADSPTIVHAANIPESMMLSPQKTVLETIANDSAKIPSLESNVTNTGDTFTLLSNLNNSEQTVVHEASPVVDISDIPINPNSKQQEIATDTDILKQQEVFSTQQQENLPDTITNSQEITNIATDLISNSLPESSNSLSRITQPSIEDTPNLSPDLPNISEVPSAIPKTEYSTTVNALDAGNIPTLTTPEIISNVPVQLASTSPVIADKAIVTSESVNFVDAPENITSLETDNASNVPVELAPTSPVIADKAMVTSESQPAESVNFVDASANVTPLPSDSASNVPVELPPTPPVIADKAIIPSESVNLSDIRENVIPVQADNASNLPVELAPTSPVIADKAMVTSESQPAESVNLLDVRESVVSSPDDIPTVVTPPILRESTEVDTVDGSAMSDDKPLPVYASVTSSIISEVINQEQPVEPDLPSTVTSFIFTENEAETLDNLPAPQGFATGGQVTQSSVENPQIASSDTVPAMLTPGEFIVNAHDAQKNLHILRHINTGGTPEDIILPSLELPTPETPTKVDSFADISLQRQHSDSRASEESKSLIPSSLGTEISQQRLSSHSSLQLNTIENKATATTEPSPHYSLPTLIFRKPSSNTNASYDTPTQWSTVEELLNGNNDPFTSFNFNSGESNWQNSQYSQPSKSSESPQIFTKRLTSPQGFANGGEVTASNIARDIQPITETIQSPSAAIPEADESGNLEALAYEIYNRLRQRIEVERERQGIYLGRLPW